MQPLMESQHLMQYAFVEFWIITNPKRQVQGPDEMEGMSELKFLVVLQVRQFLLYIVQVTQVGSHVPQVELLGIWSKYPLIQTHVLVYKYLFWMQLLQLVALIEQATHVELHWEQIWFESW